MKVFFVWLLLAVQTLALLIPGGDYHQLSQLNELNKHYQEHLDRGDQLSFTDFLVQHYSDAKNHEDAANHSELPLMHQCAGAIHFFEWKSFTVKFVYQAVGFVFPALVYEYNFSDPVFNPLSLIKPPAA